MMRRPLLYGLVVVAACLGLAVAAAACSENVFRPGHGMAYRKLATILPARVLIDAEPASNTFTLERATELQLGLEEAGHRVVVAEDARKLAAMLEAEAFDVVLTSADRASALAEPAASENQPPSGLPVVARGTGAPLRARFPHALAADASLRQVLKAIERTMESRR
jgi:hypothetical protein